MSKYKRNFIEKEELYVRYVTQGKSMRQIAIELKCSEYAVYKYIHKHGIPVRENLSKVTKEYLIQQYADKKLSTTQIAKEVGCSTGFIKLQLKRFQIPMHPRVTIGSKANKHARIIEDLKGKKFRLLTPIEYIPKKGWFCSCECGGTIIVHAHSLIRGQSKSCGCLINRKGRNCPGWQGHGDIPKSIFTMIQHGAKSRNLPFQITIEFAWNLLVKQNHCCAITGIPIGFEVSRGPKITASLDRIDSSKGYIEGNVQWVHKRINEMKWNYDQNDFIKWCRLVADHNPIPIIPL